jgi:hypothetical protein
MISLTIKKKLISLSAHEQGLATAAHARSALAPEFQAAIAARTTETSLSQMISESTLERMVVKYSEQLVFQPLQEIRYWFTYSSGAFLEPGYPPLYYGRDRNRSVSPNKSAVSAIGEGIAGFLAQRLYRCTKLARPNHDYPDIVMEGQYMTFLVEAKATLRSEEEQIETVVDSELPRLASLTSSAKLLDVRPIRGLLIGTMLVSEVEYYCYMLELELV